MQKNIASQKWRVFAFDRTTNTPLTGDAANITAKISKDFGTANATNDTNPTEVEDGYYEFDMSQAETNADDLLILPQSSTANVVVIGCPARISTTPVGWSDDVVQTGDAFALIGTAGAGLTNINLPNQTMDIIGNITGSLSGSVGSVTAAITLPTIPADWITANGIAADAIGSSELAASAVTEIQSGLATAAILDIIAADVVNLDGAAMRGTDNAALAATALSTAVWTNTLATNLGTTNTTVATNLDAVLSTRATPAQVNTEVLDVLNVDTFAEETGVPAATSSLRTKIGWMFMWFRNRVTQTGTTSTLYADDGSTAVGTHTVSDDATTFTSGEGA